MAFLQRSTLYLIDNTSNNLIDDTTLEGRMPRWAPPLALALLVSLVFGNTLSGPFLFDDYYSIVNNHSIRTLLPLSHSLWGARGTPTSGRPLVNFSFAVNYAIGKHEVFGYHLGNILLHWANATLIYLLCLRVFELFPAKDVSRRYATAFAFAVASLWSVHPIQTETVSYITQRTELMFAFFLLLTLYFSRRSWDANSTRSAFLWYVASVFACGLGMACKEVMVIAPVVVVLYDMAFLNQSIRAILQKRWKFYVSLASCWGILACLLASGPRGRSAGFGLETSSFDYFKLQCWAIVHYLWLSIWPARLVGDYGEYKPVSFDVWFPPFLALIVLGGVSIFTWFRKRELGFLLCGLFVLLAPTSSFVPIVTEPVAERRMYLPLALLVMIVAFTAIRLESLCLSSTDRNHRKLKSGYLIPLVAIVVFMTALCGYTSYSRNVVYQDEIRFWLDVTSKRPTNSRGFTHLALAYTAANHPEDAFANFQKALEIEPTNTSAICNLGNWYSNRGQVTEAIQFYQRTIELNPRIQEAHFNLGLALFKDNRTDEAIQHYRTAIEIDPYFTQAFVELGNALFVKGAVDEAIQSYQSALKIEPNTIDAIINLGAVLGNIGKRKESIDVVRKAISLDPTHSMAYHNLVANYVALNQIDDIVRTLEECVKNVPNDLVAWQQLAKVYAMRGQTNEARACFHEVLRIQPDHPETLQLLRQLGEPE